MQEDMAEQATTQAAIPRRTIWNKITSGRGSSRVIRIGIGIVVLAALMAITVSLYNAVPAESDPGLALDIPETWDIGWDVMKVLDDAVEWVVVQGDPVFDVIRKIVVGILVPFRDFLLWIPWWLTVAAVGLTAWRIVGRVFGLLAAAFLAFMIFMGHYDAAMMTLAVTLTATLLCVLVGVPTGIVAAKSERFDRILRPILDMMQTIPSFVYLIPALMLFGLGMTPAVMATFIYAVPPIIRLTNLGIRQVDQQVIEAAKSFGTTSWQMLGKVQIPLAMPTILAGLNQTVMMALAMVVIASMVGAPGVGTEILTGLNRLEMGRGILGGLTIVFMAIMLDRISQGFASRGPATQSAS